MTVLTMWKKRAVGNPRRIVWTMANTKSNIFETSEKEEEENCDWTKFAGRSTCAAVIHLADQSQPVPAKIVWRITLVVGIVLTATSTYFSASSFMSFTGHSEMMLQTERDNRIEHPRYHICTSNTFNLTILKEMGFVEAEMISYLTLMTSLFVVSPSLVRDVERQRQLETKFNEILNEKGIEDVAEILRLALLKCEDIIAGCILSPAVHVDGFECCAKFFPLGSFVSPTGACVTTFSAPPIIQRIPTLGFGLVVLVKDLRVTRALDNSIINPIMANQKGVTFSVTDKWTDPMVALLRERHYTRIGLWTSVAISRTTINDEEIMHSVVSRKLCATRDGQNTFLHLVPAFKNYTLDNCVYAARQKRITEIINCYIITLPYKGNLPPCRPQQMLNLALRFFSAFGELTDPMFGAAKDCVTECWREKYDVSASYADLQWAANFRFGNWTISPNQSNQLAALNFFYPTFTQNLLVNHYPTINQGLGILGGNLGLFLGASMVTLIELIVFCFSCCCRTKTFK
ncbi:uncharacterized protein LOC130687737 [Daphnia carinata]|uniref:uncharacterized protein LOC130687737 n=1 Tax=Daphnia carinata TaxID=120202 RepID=UPI00258089E6|nr:uncharacterized protein LOC130687737 [Daphnia carinata]